MNYIPITSSANITALHTPKVALTLGNIPLTDVSCWRPLSNFGEAFLLNLFYQDYSHLLLWDWHFTLLKLIGTFISYFCYHVQWSDSYVLQQMLNKISIYESHVNHSFTIFWDHIFNHLLIFSLQLTIITHISFILHHLKSSSHHLIWIHYSSILMNLIKWVKMSSHYHDAYKYSPTNLSNYTLLKSQSFQLVNWCSLGTVLVLF